MKNVTEQEIIIEINDLIYEIENNWGAFGDLSEWVRVGLIRKLKRIKRMIKKPKRIIFKKLKGGRSKDE